MKLDDYLKATATVELSLEDRYFEKNFIIEYNDGEYALVSSDGIMHNIPKTNQRAFLESYGIGYPEDFEDFNDFLVDYCYDYEDISPEFLVVMQGMNSNIRAVKYGKDSW